MADYIGGANRESLSVITIEHPDAVNRIDEICATPGVDLAFIGPGDLAMSMGHPGEIELHERSSLRGEQRGVGSHQRA